MAKLDHLFRLKADSDHRISFIVDSEFAVFTSKGETEVDQVGPPSAVTRQASVRVPEGCDGLIIKTPKGACLTLLGVHPCQTKERLDDSKHPDYVSADMVPDMTESIANQIAKALFLRGELRSEPESFEEANDFDMDDEEDFPFEVHFRRMVEEVVDTGPDEVAPSIAPETGAEAAGEAVDEPIASEARSA